MPILGGDGALLLTMAKASKMRKTSSDGVRQASLQVLWTNG